jgi:hypothetical protein
MEGKRRMAPKGVASNLIGHPAQRICFNASELGIINSTGILCLRYAFAIKPLSSVTRIFTYGLCETGNNMLMLAGLPQNWEYLQPHGPCSESFGDREKFLPITCLTMRSKESGFWK